MSTRQEDLRRDAIGGTKAIWSLTTYTATVVLVFVMVPFMVPFMTPLETPDKPISLWAGLIFWLVVVVVFYTSFRNRVWRPIHALARILNDPRVMRQHCIDSMRGALPYALAFALPAASLMFDFQIWVFALQFGAVILIDNWMGAHRKPRITTLVDQALSAN